MPPIPTYQDAYNSLGSVYDPQTSQVNTEIAQLAPQQQAQQASLDQAKVNAFSDITSRANSRGMLFSGFTPAEQGVYTGTKYLPAVANLQTSFNNQKNTLLDKINQINATRANQAQGVVSSAQANAIAAQKAAETAAYHNDQLNLGYARLGASQSRAATAAANKPLSASQVVAAIRQNLERVKGGDQHVAPQDLAQAYKDYTSTGASPSSFWKYFQGYWNPNQSNYSQKFYGSIK